MTTNVRNSKAILILIFSMSAAAGALFLLETPTHGWAEDGSAMDTNGWLIESVIVEVAPSGPSVDPLAYDCAIMPSGDCYWQPGNARLRLAIIGPPDEPLTTEQARALLGVLGTLSQFHGFDLAQVSLARQNGPKIPGDAAVLNADIRDLLVKKGIIQ